MVSKNKYTALELSHILPRSVDGEKLCLCNKCFSILYDENPQVGAEKYDTSGFDVTSMDYKEGVGHVCPNCDTDNYLMDI